jgi:hypothetical protein
VEVVVQLPLDLQVTGCSGGAGGAGAPNTILGPATTYAGGGGGGGQGTAGVADLVVVEQVVVEHSALAGTAGSANTGGGGGGAGRFLLHLSKAGGSGIVIARAPSEFTFTVAPELIQLQRCDNSRRWL